MRRLLAVFYLLIFCPLGSATEPATPVAAVQLSPTAQQLASHPETAEGLHRRLGIILRELTAQSTFYHTDTLPSPALELIPLTVSKGTPRHLGGTRWAAGRAQVFFRMDFFTAALPPASGTPVPHLRELILVDTLVHELAHCFFFARYPKLGLQSSEAALSICEGYAIHVACTFIRQHYLATESSALAYYEQHLLSPRYKRLYRSFRQHYLSPTGGIHWQAIDAQELRVAPPGYTLRNRTQMHPDALQSL